MVQHVVRYMTEDGPKNLEDLSASEAEEALEIARLTLAMPARPEQRHAALDVIEYFAGAVH